MDRLWTLIDATGSCWLWTGAQHRDGYGKFAGTTAHRVVYQRLVGAIPVEMELDHLCRNVLCCNPDHLEPVTRAENMRRCYALVTHCSNGHRFTPANTYIKPNGYRQCRACNKAAVLKYRKRVAA